MTIIKKDYGPRTSENNFCSALCAANEVRPYALLQQHQAVLARRGASATSLQRWGDVFTRESPGMGPLQWCFNGGESDYQ